MLSNSEEAIKKLELQRLWIVKLVTKKGMNKKAKQIYMKNSLIKKGKKTVIVLDHL